MLTHGTVPARTATYLGCLDRQMEPFVPYRDWERFLVASLLFEPQLVVPDVFLVISHHLEQHLSGHLVGQSLFEKAMAAGLITVALRQPEKSLVGNLEAMEQQGILGILPQARKTALRLASSWTPHQDPESLRLLDQRELFRDMVFSMLGERPPRVVEAYPENQRIWDATRSWREPALAAAYEWSLRADGRGLRRGHLLTAFGRGLGWKGDVHDIGLLLRSIGDEEQRDNAAIILRWMNEIYQASGAAVLGLSPGFPGSVPEYAIVPHQLLPAGSGETEAETFVIPIEVPAPHVLLQMSPDSLLGARKEFGLAYLPAVDDWKNGAQNQEAVREHAQAYCAALKTWAKREGAGLPSRGELGLTRAIGPLFTSVVMGILKNIGPTILYLSGNPTFGVFLRLFQDAVVVPGHTMIDQTSEFKHYGLTRQRAVKPVELLSISGLDVELL